MGSDGFSGGRPSFCPISCWPTSGAGRRVHGDDVLLTPEHVEHRVGLLVIVHHSTERQASGQGPGLPKRSIVVQGTGRCSGADGSVVTGTPYLTGANLTGVRWPVGKKFRKAGR
jgi:hypothetical protein